MEDIVHEEISLCVYRIINILNINTHIHLLQNKYEKQLCNILYYVSPVNLYNKIGTEYDLGSCNFSRAFVMAANKTAPQHVIGRFSAPVRCCAAIGRLRRALTSAAKYHLELLNCVSKGLILWILSMVLVQASKSLTRVLR